MIFKNLFTMVSTLLILCSLINSSEAAQEWWEIPPVPPIFDGNIGYDRPPLHLFNIEGHIVVKMQDPSKGIPKFTATGPGLKSKQVTLVKELWHDDGWQLQVIIRRYFFEYKEDAAVFPASGYLLTNNTFLGWDKNPEWAPSGVIGEKTYWLYPNMLYFVKGKVFVSVCVMCRQDLGAQFTERIARNLEQKL